MVIKAATARNAHTPTRSGLQFGVPALVPGLLASAAIAMGAPLIGIVAVAGVALFAGAAGATAMAAGAAAVIGAIVVGSAGAASIAVGVAVGAGVVCTALALTVNLSRQRYSAKKVLTGVLGGSVLGAALTFAAASNPPQAPDPVAKAAPSPTLPVETRKDALRQDFNLAEQPAAPVVESAAGRKVYPLTMIVPECCLPKP